MKGGLSVLPTRKEKWGNAKLESTVQWRWNVEFLVIVMESSQYDWKTNQKGIQNQD